MQAGRSAKGWAPSRASLTGVAHGREDRAFLLAAGMYVFFGTLDVLTTARALTHGAHERNPLAAALYTHYGIASLYLFKAAVVALVLVGLALLPRRVGIWVATVFAVVVGTIVIANAHAITALY
jgi:Domain of unknown function (DUF5658)